MGLLPAQACGRVSRLDFVAMTGVIRIFGPHSRDAPAASYRESPPREVWWAHQDSNLGQTGYEPAALTAELWARSRR